MKLRKREVLGVLTHIDDRPKKTVPVTKAIPKSPHELEKVTFRKLKRGETVAEKPFTDSALLNTYESFSRTLAEMRAFIKSRARDGMALHEKLKDNFGTTELGRAATDESWMMWVDDFLKQNATARSVALVFLEDKTGLKRGTLKVRFSAARNKQKNEKLTTPNKN